MKYRMPGGTPGSREDVTEKIFEAKNDEDAVVEGKAKFLKSAEHGYIPSGSVLLEIFQTPANLLKKRCRIEEQKEQSSFSLVLVK